MFNSELYKISKEAMQNIDLEKVEIESQKIEKKVLEIIKKNARRMDKNGLVKIVADSKTNREDYQTLYNIIVYGKKRYYEEEYSLYLIDSESEEDYLNVYNTIIFIWNSYEYYQKNRIHQVGITK